MKASTSAQPTGVPRFIDGGCLELVSIIGTGAYGVVYLAIDTRYGEPVYRAVKCLQRHGLDSRQRHFQRREIALHRLASNHSSIVTMDRLLEEGDHLFVVMDYGDEGDLFAMICERQRYVGLDDLIKNVFLQLLDGVAWLHSLGIAHRDIKPENVVCSNDGTRVRIVDFGLATSETSSTEFGCGSTFYIAPECLGDWFPENTHYPTQNGDVWSLGVILVNLVCGRNPWRIASPSDESFNAFRNDPTFLRRILPISDSCLSILTRIFTVNPSERISLAELRRLIIQIPSFTMGEEELRIAHYAAQASATDYKSEVKVKVTNGYNSVEREDTEDWNEETVFVFDEQETPSLRADSGSPSPPHRSRSRSFEDGSLPPTPLLGADESASSGLAAFSTSPVWELFKQGAATASKFNRHPYLAEVQIDDTLCVAPAGSFFR